MLMNPSSSRGFSLVEMAIVVLVMGMLLTFAVPSIRSLSDSYQLRGAAENIAGQFRLAREKAIGTGTDQLIQFRSPKTYKTLQGASTVATWSLPNHISYVWATGTDSNYTVAKDGRMDKSAKVILTDRRGYRDTISVQLSGLVLYQ
jgi:prepilin-type N-terminal cleavage/methylation domain-containing protein